MRENDDSITCAVPPIFNAFGSKGVSRAAGLEYHRAVLGHSLGYSWEAKTLPDCWSSGDKENTVCWIKSSPPSTTSSIG